VVRETAPPVDLDDRQPCAVLGLEGGIAGDIHLAQLEAELLAELRDNAAGALAQVAARGVIDGDARPRDRCRG